LPADSPFRAFGLAHQILDGIAAAGFSEPRPIQTSTIPAALEGRDVLGLAQTGTGKTAAFVLPILQRILAATGSPASDVKKHPRRPRALVVAPTRELAQQIDSELRALARFARLQSVTIYGGVSHRPQVAALERGQAVIVACPGRLLDLHRSGAVDLSGIETLVLDEADHMFDMGFLPDIRRIVDALPEKRQNLLFSATMPEQVRGLANGLLSDPHVVELAHSGPAHTIEHSIYQITEKEKLGLLEQMLSGDDLSSAIVFTKTKYRARRLAKKLDELGYRSIALQGNLSQQRRDEAMRGFRQGKYNVLVATDIAARGIDVAKVSHVINFDTPNTPDAYIHRIGRTGRSEVEGKAFTFAVPDDRSQLAAIERRVDGSIPRLDREGNLIERTPARRRRPSRDGQSERPNKGGRTNTRHNRRRRGSGPTGNGGADRKSRGSRPAGVEANGTV
jgi:ATP-dependent RNA helicase RhlE